MKKEKTDEEKKKVKLPVIWFNKIIDGMNRCKKRQGARDSMNKTGRAVENGPTTRDPVLRPVLE